MLYINRDEWTRRMQEIESLTIAAVLPFFEGDKRENAEPYVEAIKQAFYSAQLASLTEKLGSRMAKIMPHETELQEFQQSLKENIRVVGDEANSILADIRLLKCEVPDMVDEIILAFAVAERRAHHKMDGGFFDLKRLHSVHQEYKLNLENVEQMAIQEPKANRAVRALKAAYLLASSDRNLDIEAAVGRV